MDSPGKVFAPAMGCQIVILGADDQGRHINALQVHFIQLGYISRVIELPGIPFGYGKKGSGYCIDKFQFFLVDLRGQFLAGSEKAVDRGW